MFVIYYFLFSMFHFQFLTFNFQLKMKRLDEFRIFYNHTIHPELLRMERKRKRLLWLLVGSALVMIFVLFLGFYINIVVITLIIALMIGLFMSYLWHRIQQFIQTFKPNIINLILDFIDDSINYGTFKYDAKKSIPKSRFLSSRLFVTGAPYYQGEDYIEGKIGEIKFEMCELDVREYSEVRSRLTTVFKGIFMYATFHRPMSGTILVWPKEFRQYLTKTIKSFTFDGGRNIDRQMDDKSFRDKFLTYATNDSDVETMLPEKTQAAIVEYRQRTDKEIYMAFIGKRIFIGVTEEKDILEPYLRRSNVSFELVREFFEDIRLAISILEDFYENH